MVNGVQDQSNETPTAQKRVPWNQDKVTGAKPPLRPKHVWSIWTKLQIEGRTRDLAMFNLAIDSKLRGCDVVAIRQKKTKRPAARQRDNDGPCGRVLATFSTPFRVLGHAAGGRRGRLRARLVDRYRGPE